MVMNQCTEIAIFKISEDNSQRAIELSEAIFAEMNAVQSVITAHQILRKTDNPEEICWHLTWVSADAAKAITEKRPTFPSTKEFQELVIQDLYYGHFVKAV